MRKGVLAVFFVLIVLTVLGVCLGQTRVVKEPIVNVVIFDVATPPYAVIQTDQGDYPVAAADAKRLAMGHRYARVQEWCDALGFRHAAIVLPPQE